MPERIFPIGVGGLVQHVPERAEEGRVSQRAADEHPDAVTFPLRLRACSIPRALHLRAFYSLSGAE